ncbi:MAG TPA: NAD(P)/FAD-dependent oxidoreductase [Candidatus Cybelea sp.]|jgi:monoamine oxidase
MSDADAVVIGAGAAGLSAARSLADRSLRVVLLEARDRIGGRVWSRPVTRQAVPAELGAEFIHGSAPRTMTLLREAGAAAIDIGGVAWVRGRNGKLVHEPDEFLDSAAILERSRSLPKDESVEHFLRRFAKEPALLDTLASARMFVEGFEAADPAIASVQAIADELLSGADSTSARPLGGYAPVFDLLHRACVDGGVELRLSSIVRRLIWRRGEVEVDTLNAGGDVETIRARVAVVTLPIGVLKHRGDDDEVVFEPELPAQKRVALDSLEMGHVVKIALWFRTPFWERITDGRYRDAAFFRIDGGSIGVYWTQVPVRSEMIVAWTGGPRAVALNRLSADERTQRALDELRHLLGAATGEEFESALTHDWSDDRFSRGAYSYVAVGGGNARAVLGEPVDATLFFAGEATSTDGQGGTVNGALESGDRAAAEAARVLRG